MFHSLVLALAFACLALIGAPAGVAAVPWSRSLPSGTLKGFPITTFHLVVAQGAGNHTLFAFDVQSGSPAWTIAFHEELFPFALAFDNLLSHDNIAVFQGQQMMYGVDVDRGIVKWSHGSMSSPVYLPAAMSDGLGLMTSLYVNSTSPRCLTGIAADNGNDLWVDCDHNVFAETLDDGAALPVVVTDKTFFGCFQSPRNAALSIVLEIQLDDPAFPPHIFDAYPNTVMMTNRIGFLTHSDNERENGAARHHHGKKESKNGQPIRVAFVISGWDSANRRYSGPSTVVNVIAQAGFISWRSTLHSALQQPIAFFIRRQPDLHQIVVSDGLSFVVALASASGHTMWNSTVNTTSDINLAGSTTQLSLAPVAHMLQTHHHITFSQPVLQATTDNPKRLGDQEAAATRRFHGFQATDVITVLDVFSGRFLNAAEIAGTINADFVSHNGILYIPNHSEVVAMNMTNMAMQSLYLTNSPVYPLFESLTDMRLVFGTSYSVYSFPLL